MNKIIVSATAALACSVVVSAADFSSLAASCIGLDDSGMKRCTEIIARHAFGPLPHLRDFTLAEKTAINAILPADPKAVVVVLPDGSFVIGQTVASRVIGIPCDSNPCGGPPINP